MRVATGLKQQHTATTINKLILLVKYTASLNQIFIPVDFALNVNHLWNVKLTVNNSASE